MPKTPEERRKLKEKIKRRGCTLKWRRKEIARARERGVNGVNFTCHQTLEEAEAELDRLETEKYGSPQKAAQAYKEINNEYL